MTHKSERNPIRVTRRYIHAPEAVERGLEMWASYLAQHLARRLTDEAKARREGPA